MPRLVVARREDEPLDWTQALPPHWQVTVYNAGTPIVGEDFDPPLTMLDSPRGLHAAALFTDSVLRHLQDCRHAAPDDLTVFTPGDPLLHAPDFLALLDHADRFAEVQPLSVGTGLAAQLAEQDSRDWLDQWPVRAERFSLATLVPLAHANDTALRTGRAYRRKHGLGEQHNLLAHFLGLAGLETLAGQARDADLGVAAHGPVFAVRRRALAQAVSQWGHRLDALRTLARADQNYPEIFQLTWLHLMGLPFVSLAGLSVPPMATVAAVAPAMSRVVASIDAVLAQAEPTRASTRTTDRTFGLPVLTEEISPLPNKPLRPTVSVAELREQAQQAAATGDLHTAWARLDLALQLSPRHIDLLADAATLAYGQGDTERALHCARRALVVDPNHLDCLFTLGMCLAATGQADEALNVLARLGEHPQAQHWQAEHPEFGGAINDVVGNLLGNPTAAPMPRRTAAA